jgi:hypothetical protein
MFFRSVFSARANAAKSRTRTCTMKSYQLARRDLIAAGGLGIGIGLAARIGGLVRGTCRTRVGIPRIPEQELVRGRGRPRCPNGRYDCRGRVLIASRTAAPRLPRRCQRWPKRELATLNDDCVTARARYFTRAAENALFAVTTDVRAVGPTRV